MRELCVPGCVPYGGGRGWGGHLDAVCSAEVGGGMVGVGGVWSLYAHFCALQRR